MLVSMSDRVVRIVVKYCGGCNPQYDRVDLVRRVQERCKDIARFIPAGEEVGDALMVIHGCHVQCAETADFSHLPTVSISCPEDISGMIERIQTMLADLKTEEP